MDRDKRLPAPPYASIDDAPPDLVARALAEKHPWIRRYINEGCPRGVLMKYAREYAQAQNIPKDQVPPYTTLMDWARRCATYGLVGLVDKVRADAGRQRAIGDPVANLIPILRAGGKKTPAQIVSELAALLPTQEVPKYRTLLRAVRKLECTNPHLMVLADQGLPGWRNRYRLALSGRSHAGGAVLAVDSTVANIWVRVRDATAPTGWAAKRLVLTVVEDVGSRLLVAFNFSFKAIDSGTLMGVLRRAVVQEANYPGLLSTGMPRRIILDRGAENQGAFKRMLEEYGVEIIATRDNEPELNARNERLIQTVQLEVFASMAGFTNVHEEFDPYAPPERDAKRRFSQLKYEPYRLELPVEMLPRVEDVEVAVLGWAHVYNARSHTGLPVDSPEFMEIAALAEVFDTLGQGGSRD